MHHLLSGPAVHRFQLTGLVFDVLGLSMSRDDALALLEKLDVIERDRLEARDTGVEAGDEEPDGR